MTSSTDTQTLMRVAVLLGSLGGGGFLFTNERYNNEADVIEANVRGIGWTLLIIYQYKLMFSLRHQTAWTQDRGN